MSSSLSSLSSSLPFWTACNLIEIKLFSAFSKSSWCFCSSANNSASVFCFTSLTLSISCLICPLAPPPMRFSAVAPCSPILTGILIGSNRLLSPSVSSLIAFPIDSPTSESKVGIAFPNLSMPSKARL